MPKRNDGNEQDLRVRPGGHSLDHDNPMTGARPEGFDPCVDTHGSQEDFVIDTPDGENRLYDWTDLSEICPKGFSPRLINRFFMQVLKNHFSRPDCISSESVKPYTYSTDPDQSRLKIVMNTSFDTANGASTPSLVVKRGRQRMQRVGIGDRQFITEEDEQYTTYTRFVQGSHRILCMGAAAGFTEELAFEVFSLMNAVSSIITNSPIPFHDFQVNDLSESGILDDLGNSLAIAVEVVYAYEYSWTLYQPAPTLHQRIPPFNG